MPLPLGPATFGTHAVSNDLPHATHKRIASLDSATPISKGKAQVPRRLSLQTQSPLPTLPNTPAEWNKAVAEVKRNYINRRYRSCSARCCEILDNVKDITAVEPAYLLYLHFYAACSVEMLARPLNPSSPYRIKLLQQARSHYHRASELIRTADESMSRSSRPSSAATSRSGQHTPSSSFSSHGSSEVSSYMGSIYSPDDAIVTKLSPPPPLVPRHPAKKRVTFDDSHHEPNDEPNYEPNVRPDSPTLGLDCSPHAAQLPCKTRHLPDASEQPRTRLLCSLPSTPEPPAEDGGAELAFSFVRERSIHRYCAILATLRIQLASYLASLDAQLTPYALAGAGVRSHFSFSMPARAASPESLTLDDEMRSLQLRARIERLRAAGWERPRFNAQRYKELCDSVLTELSSY
ncbi:hypothetical protein ACRALDRAFT_1068171 [Sodiomyces alcalophilus JCM 7366]|uniref:uncharacterized protein n=1 Tax=Sodiomyces alcalophilus JCM 7366 TaxID=591952 RepID=UPI0039B59980